MLAHYKSEEFTKMAEDLPSEELVRRLLFQFYLVPDQMLCKTWFNADSLHPCSGLKKKKV